MNKLLFMVLLNSVLLFACQQKNSSSVIAEANHNERPSAAPKITKEVKPGAQISLASENMVELEANKTTRVELVLSAQMNNDSHLHIELNPGDGLQLVGSEKSYDFSQTSDDQYRFSVDVNAKTNGRYYLNINATISAGELSSPRSLAVIVQVGALSTVERSEKILKTTSSENIISLPAQEHIINQ